MVLVLNATHFSCPFKGACDAQVVDLEPALEHELICLHQSVGSDVSPFSVWPRMYSVVR
jgi:hypothetical protein